MLRDEAFNITKNPKYDDHQCGLPSMEVLVEQLKKNEIIFNKELGEKLHKLVIRKF